MAFYFIIIPIFNLENSVQKQNIKEKSNVKSIYIHLTLK